MFAFFLDLFRQNPFRQHVAQVLAENGYAENEILQQFFRRTRFDQEFVFVLINRNGGFYVLLILDELHRNKMVVKLQRNTPKSYIIKTKYFGYENQARDYISQKIRAYKLGTFDNEKYYYRIVKCKPECQHPIARIPDACGCFLPGDYLIRDLDGFKYASHAGIYCSRNKIAHFDSPDRAATIWNCITGNGNHMVHLASMENFLTNPTQEIRILVHCFQQSTIKDKVTAAVELAQQKYGKERYSIVSHNCQHFASLISTGRLEMIDQDMIDGVAVVGGAALIMAIGGAAALAYKYFTSRTAQVATAVAADGNATAINVNNGSNAIEVRAIEGNVTIYEDDEEQQG